MRSPRRLLAAVVVVPALALAGCGGSGGTVEPTSTTPAATASAPVTTGDLGIGVTGTIGEKPTLTIPETDSPAELTSEVIVQGDGPEVASGETIIVNYLGQTWKPKDGEPNVFDNSFDSGQPTGFQIGTGRVISGWDKGLVGQKAGTRVLLAIPAKDAYGEETSAENELAGQALVFVVDVLGSVAQTATATGSAGAALPAGFPAITSESGKQPEITSIEGVKAPAVGGEPLSHLLLKGGGDPIDAQKSLAVQLVQTDTATGKQTSKSWGDGGGAQLVPAAQVLETIPALQGATVGSRAVIVTPPTESNGTTNPSLVVVVDVVGQY